MVKFEQITAVDATDMPPEVEEWCLENDVSLHYENSMVQVEDDGNPFANWLKENGFMFKKDWEWIGVFGT